MSQEMNGVQVYNIRDIERVMNCKRKLAQKILDCGDFPIVKVGRYTFVTIENFNKWLSEGGTTKPERRRKVTPLNIQ